MKPAVGAVGAVVAAAAIGSLTADPGSAWYRALRKPAWQPPPAAFPLVWTPLYATIAWAGARGLSRATGGSRGRIARTFLIDLALNTAWTPLFFRARRPRAALAEVACLNAANAALLRALWQADRASAVLLLPYLGWTAFATALNAEIVHLNPRS